MRNKKNQVLILVVCALFATSSFADYKIIFDIIVDETPAFGSGGQEEPVSDNAIELSGPSDVYPNDKYNYQIDNYDENETYNASATKGSVSINNSYIQFDTSEFASDSQTTATISISNSKDENGQVDVAINPVGQEVVGITATTGGVRAFNANDRVVWHQFKEQRADSIALHGGYAYTFVDGDVARLDIDTGEIDWQTDVDKQLYHQKDSFGVDQNGNVYALHIGERRSDGYASTLYKITPNGKVDWTFSETAEIATRVGVNDAGDIYITGYYDAGQYQKYVDSTEYDKDNVYVRKISPQTGSSVWLHERYSGGGAHVVAVADDGAFYITHATNDYYLWYLTQSNANNTPWYDAPNHYLVDALGEIPEDWLSTQKSFSGIKHDNYSGSTYLTIHNPAKENSDHILEYSDSGDVRNSAKIVGGFSENSVDFISSEHVYISDWSAQFGEKRFSKDLSQEQYLDEDVDNINVALHRGIENYDFTWKNSN